MDLWTGGSLVIRTLEHCGARVVFGIPGVHNLGIYEALQESSLCHVTPRHEQGAGFMADGYARSSALPGVALVISGPGLTNILTPLGEAYHDSVPLLVISSNIPRNRLGGRTGTLHELKQSTLMTSSVTKASYAVSRGEEIPWILSRAYAQTLEGRPGPVHVEIPLDILEEMTSFSSLQELEREYCSLVKESRTPSSEDLRRGTALLEKSRKIALICGGGAVGASEEVRKFADRFGAPVFCTAAGKGIYPEDAPLSGTRVSPEPRRSFGGGYRTLPGGSLGAALSPGARDYPSGCGSPSLASQCSRLSTPLGGCLSHPPRAL